MMILVLDETPADAGDPHVQAQSFHLHPQAKMFASIVQRMQLTSTRRRAIMTTFRNRGLAVNKQLDCTK